jgi:hypothetical protein
MGTGSTDRIGRIHDFHPLRAIISQFLMDGRHVGDKSRAISLPAKPLQAQQCVRPDPKGMIVLG